MRKSYWKKSTNTGHLGEWPSVFTVSPHKPQLKSFLNYLPSSYRFLNNHLTNCITIFFLRYFLDCQQLAGHIVFKSETQTHKDRNNLAAKIEQMNRKWKTYLLPSSCDRKISSTQKGRRLLMLLQLKVLNLLKRKAEKKCTFLFLLVLCYLNKEKISNCSLFFF